MMPPRARALASAGEGGDLREHLIAVTGRLLAEQGLEGLTTRRIAEAADVAHGVLYNHFANKDELILAGLVARASALFDEFHGNAPSPGGGTVEGNLGRFAAAMLDLQRGLLPLLAGLIGKRALLGRFLAALHSREIGGPERILEALHAYLAEEERLGRARGGENLHLVGVLLFAIAQLQALAIHFRKPGATPAAAARELDPFVGFLAGTLIHDPEGDSMPTHISLMLAVDDAAEAAAWYERALGASQLWSLGSVVGLEIEGAPFFLHEPTRGFVSPAASGDTTVRVEVFVDDPDAFVRRAVDAGAEGSRDPVREHRVPWGTHRQGGFRDPFGHTWLVGDKTPLARYPQTVP